jgi:DNA-directed RNA polymerase subunit M/transcription elongation factor TFIIS
MPKSDRPTPTPSITTPAMQPVKPPRRHSQNAIKYPSQRPKAPVQEQEQARCVVCNGKVIEHHENREGSTRHSMTVSGYHCEDCGIVYAFLPKKKKR